MSTLSIVKASREIFTIQLHLDETKLFLLTGSDSGENMELSKILVISERGCALGDENYCSAVLFDVALAFDKVYHDGLLYKIKEINKILKSYLVM